MEKFWTWYSSMIEVPLLHLTKLVPNHTPSKTMRQYFVLAATFIGLFCTQNVLEKWKLNFNLPTNHILNLDDAILILDILALWFIFAILSSIALSFFLIYFLEPTIKKCKKIIENRKWILKISFLVSFFLTIIFKVSDRFFSHYFPFVFEIYPVWYIVLLVFIGILICVLFILTLFFWIIDRITIIRPLIICTKKQSSLKQKSKGNEE